MSAAAAPAPLPRAVYEDFLYAEAALLDAWKLDEWFALFAEGATYEVPTAGAPDDADSSEALFYIADDHARLRHRLSRLQKPGAHSERPRSIGVRMISNVRILGSDDAGVEIGCVFATYRSKDDVTDAFRGHCRYLLKEIDGALKILSKRVMLDMGNLRPQGRISIIL